MTTIQARQEVFGSVLLVEFSDQRRALMTNQALNPDEFKQLSLDCSAAGGRVLEIDGRRLLALFTQPGDGFAFAQRAQKFTDDLRTRNPDRHSLAARAILGHGALTIEGGRARGPWLHRLPGLVSRVPAHCVGGLQAFTEALPRSALPSAARPLGDDLFLLQSTLVATADTQLASPLDVGGLGVFTAVTLRVGGVPRVFRAADCPVLIGRDDRCAVRVSSEAASRIHGRIEYANGKFYFVDDSRNGSWVLIGSGEEIKLNRDRIVLAGEGAISPGAPLSQQKGEVLRYDCHATRLSMPGEQHDGDTKQL